jgi:hypothetical protein
LLTLISRSPRRARQGGEDRLPAGVEDQLLPFTLLTEEKAFEIGLDDGGGVEVRIEGGADPEQQQQGPLQQDPFLRNLEGVLEIGQADVQRAQIEQGSQLVPGIEFQILERPALDANLAAQTLVKKFHHPIEHVRVGAAGYETHLLHRRDDAGAVAGHRALEERYHPAPHGLGHLAGGAKIEENQRRRAIGLRGPLHQEIAGMRIRVIVAVHEDLLAVRLHAGPRERARVEPLAGDGLQIGHPDPVDPFGGEHALRRQLLDDARDTHRCRALPILEVGGDAADGIRLLSVVELGHHHAANLVIDGVESIVRHHPAQKPKNPAQGAQIDAHRLFDVEVLDLDRHLLPGM